MSAEKADAPRGCGHRVHWDADLLPQLLAQTGYRRVTRGGDGVTGRYEHAYRGGYTVRRCDGHEPSQGERGGG